MGHGRYGRLDSDNGAEVTEMAQKRAEGLQRVCIVFDITEDPTTGAPRSAQFTEDPTTGTPQPVQTHN